MEAITAGGIITLVGAMYLILTERERRGKKMKRITLKDKKEFYAYCTHCTNAQLMAVYEKESKARRMPYVLLAKIEIERRG